ncbi:hypothetical protein FHT40_001294 [Mycolicibacterium sp. BK556]|uniref:hypothetical protein n=1 Tax=Mycobacteriaceae TaxID=1762 RepID=UPI00105BE2A7|nr:MULTISPECIES: hypothetical protein [Mycobacteriaceae]MBB3601661.1 hypothetical protein [Mycolicibacterium sp. BK556]MBB3631413.1 hypothetical protein [Mycolicibacterium sp. BK607]MBB3749417.1 hypothetical protein [Mycolicibacterium sp. BK634]TDO14364.1 hypothetical protein EV580_2491 [Mycobacterium sp. BK086]
MKIAQAKTVGLIGVALLVGTAAVGCGGDDKESSSSSSSSSTSAAATTSAAASETTSAPASPAAAGGDYSKLLLKASDIDPSFTAGEPQVNPNGINGIVQSMTNPTANQTIVFAIVVSEDAAGALKALESSKAELPKEVDGAPQPADVGDAGNGLIATGKSPDGSKAITEVYFTQGKALANIEFSSNPNDPVQPDTALAIAKMQDTQIKNNLS